MHFAASMDKAIPENVATVMVYKEGHLEQVLQIKAVILYVQPESKTIASYRWGVNT